MMNLNYNNKLADLTRILKSMESDCVKQINESMKDVPDEKIKAFLTKSLGEAKDGKLNVAEFTREIKQMSEDASKGKRNK